VSVGDRRLRVSELTSRDVEVYLDRKLAENRRIETALAIGEPLKDHRRRALGRRPSARI
jgi:hypothetical protein